MIRCLNCLLLVMVAVLLTSCGAGSRSYGVRDYPDAVVSINQVDPRYRPYFRSQHSGNFSLSDQRKAFIAAAKTSRTPVPKYVPRSAAKSGKKAAPKRKAYRSSKKRASSKKKVRSSRKKKSTRSSRKRRR